jgi:MFS transporter, Spinster family, sphingosine-1-phosphate transporter
MQERSRNYRWFVLIVFFIFMLLHQADKLLIGPLTTQIMTEFNITKTQMGAVSTGALIVGALFYPLWGILYDRYGRAKLLALASLIWGSTTWLNAIAPTYPIFLMTRSSTGVDDSSYSGLYSLISDYFGPKIRGKIFGFLQITAPIGYLLGMILGLVLSGAVGWRGVFYITGSLGILLTFVIFWGVKEPPRGRSEPEFADLDKISTYKFDWQTAKDLFKIPTLRLLFIQGFFGVFPWNAITYWFFNYLETERNYMEQDILITMVIAVLVLALGYPLGGALGDMLFSRTKRGRIIIAATGVVMGAILLAVSLNIPTNNQIAFIITLSLAAIFMPFPSANVLSTVHDITVPEVRSTATAVQYFIESGGAALSPLIIGIIADQSSLKNAFLIVCLSTWFLCAVFFAFAAIYVTRDVTNLRENMQERADRERARH